jgi:hypothetical protein
VGRKLSHDSHVMTHDSDRVPAGVIVIVLTRCMALLRGLCCLLSAVSI